MLSYKELYYSFNDDRTATAYFFLLSWLRTISALQVAIPSSTVRPIRPIKTVGDSSKSKNLPKFIILPGFSNSALDYYDPFNKGFDQSFAACLAKRGVTSYIVPIERKEWLNVFGGVTEPDFWKGCCKPYGKSYGWYLERVKDTIQYVREETGDQKVVLCGHSAGGWLARAVLSNNNWSNGEKANDFISALITLGSPHFPGPMDMTRGALTYTNDTYPGAYLKNLGIKYVTVAGSAVQGLSNAPRISAQKRAFTSYQIVCGTGNIAGDGCVPIISAHLDGAVQITVPDAKHSIDTLDEWYGAEAIIDRWLPQVLKDVSPNSLPAFQFLVHNAFSNIFGMIES